MNCFKEFELPIAPVFSEFTANVYDYGARENDIQQNRQSFKDAIDACCKNGGGTVVVPAGTWKTGPIHLKSNVNLHLDEGAVLDFSVDYNDYLPVVYGYRAGIRVYCASHFIYAYKCHNIAVTGKGKLLGNGSAWWDMAQNAPGMTELQKKNKERVDVSMRVYDTRESGVRAEFLQFVECENVLVEGVAFEDSPSWTVHPVMCRNVVIRGISIKNPFKAPNTDGIDIESCKCVLVEDCYIDTGDDVICIKSGRDEDAWEHMLPCEDVLVRRCRGIGGCGGAALGSETSAGVRKILFEDCVFDKARWGIRVKTRASRGNVIENVFFKNIIIKDSMIIGIDIVMEYLDCMEKLHYNDPMYSDAKTVESRDNHIPDIKGIYFENVKSLGSPLGLQIIGIKGYEMKSIYFKNCYIESDNSYVIKDAIDVRKEGLTFGNKVLS